MVVERRFSYKPRVWTMLFVVVFFGLCAWLIGDSALHGSRGIELPPDLRPPGWEPEQNTGRVALEWLLAVVSCGFVAIGLWGLAMALWGRNEIVVGPAHLVLPRTLIRGPRSTPLSLISGLSEQKYNFQTLLNIETRMGVVTVNKGHFGSERDYLDFKQMLGSLIVRNQL